MGFKIIYLVPYIIRIDVNLKRVIFIKDLKIDNFYRCDSTQSGSGISQKMFQYPPDSPVPWIMGLHKEKDLLQKVRVFVFAVNLHQMPVKFKQWHKM